MRETQGLSDVLLIVFYVACPNYHKCDFWKADSGIVLHHPVVDIEPDEIFAIVSFLHAYSSCYHCSSKHFPGKLRFPNLGRIWNPTAFNKIQPYHILTTFFINFEWKISCRWRVTISLWTEHYTSNSPHCT